MSRPRSMIRPKLVLLSSLLAVALTTALPEPLSAQALSDPAQGEPTDTTVVHEIELRDGSTLVGYIVQVSNSRMTVRTLDDVEVTFHLNQVQRISALEGVRHGREFWPRDPSDSRLFIGPTARVPPDGRGYAGLYELFFPSGAIGLGDVAMVSGGMSIFPGVGLSEQLYYVAPKVRLAGNDRVGAAAGVLWLGLGFDDKSAGMVYGVVTAESDAAALTLGPAFPFFSDGGFTDEVLGLVGGEIRVSRRVKVMSENWFLPGDGGGAFFTLGLRWLDGSYTFEAAGLVPSTTDAVIPVVNISLTW